MIQGVYKPPNAIADFDGITVNYFPSIVAVRRVELMAGAAIGTAVISYPSHYASDATPQMGKGVRIKVGGRVIFRGVIGDGPFEVGGNSDELQLILFDDKWLMSRKTIGEPGIGTMPVSVPGFYGFNDVCFDVIFNRDGKPNKDPATLDFLTDPTAVFWTLKDVMQFVFLYYIDPDDARLNPALLSGGYDRKPSHLNLVGQTALQAVDTVAQLAGESWGLIPGSSYSAFVPVAPGSGTLRRVYFFRPKAFGRSDMSTTWHVNAGKSSLSIQECKDNYAARSGSILKEHTYTNKGSYPLLVRNTDFVDPTKEHVTQYEVDVEQYAVHMLGPALSAGSRPKKWNRELVTRLNADKDGYLTAANIAATPALRHNDRLAKPFLWVSEDGTEAAARLCTGGFRINTEHGTIEFKSKLDLWPDDGEKEETVLIEDWANVGIWLTIATLIGLPKTSQSTIASAYLPKHFTQLIIKSDLVPEQRGIVWLPKMGGSNNEVDHVSLTTEEYVDVADQLDEMVDGAIAQTPDLESPLDLDFPFMPELNIGDLIDVKGRTFALSGNEVVTQISYDIHDAYDVKVRATNVLAGVNPEKFMEPE
jgi:hypothetical protein